MSSFKSVFLYSFLSLATLFALTTAKYHINPSAVTRIINGFSALDGQFPHLVSIQLNYENEHRCGGAILNSHWIVTAAHCTLDLFDLNKYTPDSFYIVAGTSNLRKPRFTYNISRIVNHPMYNTNGLIDKDISLLQTTQEIAFNKLVQPIALPTVDIPVTIAGWGNTMNEPREYFPDDLKMVNQRTLSQEACTEDHPYLATPAVLCAHADNAAVGGCDSGGPLITSDNVLVGVVSSGSGVGESTDIYTRVYSVLEFIYSHIDDKPDDDGRDERLRELRP